MLVITRRINESIIVDGNITVTVVKVRGNRVILSVNAPVDVSVLRQEVAERIAEQKQEVSES